MLEKTLEKLDIPESAARVYSRLLELGRTTARHLSENLGLPRPSIYDQLKLLIKLGLVSELEIDNKKYFQPDDPKNIGYLLAEKITELQSAEKKFREILPKLGQKSESTEPRVKFFPGTDGFRRVLNDLLWYENIEALAMWPFREMTEVVGEEYLKNWTLRRVGHKIKIRSIWPPRKAGRASPASPSESEAGPRRGGPKNQEFPVTPKIPYEETRIAPADMKWNMGYLIYEDKVSFISSHAESFGFIVTSRDFSDLERSQFEAIWRISKPIK